MGNIYLKYESYSMFGCLWLSIDSMEKVCPRIQCLLPAHRRRTRRQGGRATSTLLTNKFPWASSYAPYMSYILIVFIEHAIITKRLIKKESSYSEKNEADKKIRIKFFFLHFFFQYGFDNKRSLRFIIVSLFLYLIFILQSQSID